MLRIQSLLTPEELGPAVTRLFELSASKIRNLHQAWNPADGAPVFTIGGRYTSRGWTEWTEGFLFGSAILQFAATGDEEALNLGRKGTRRRMATHVTHVGVHDHGFNNVSTYGTLYHLARAGEFTARPEEIDFYELALKASGAVQAARWTRLSDQQGYIYSFNGPHSLFADTIRSLRSLALAHQLGHVLMGEKDRQISLLDRLLQHAATTANYSVYFGKGRDAYDVRGRVAHEAIFNLNDGSYRCPNSQQGYSPFTTWTRGLAWILCGFAEQLEYLSTLPDSAFGSSPAKAEILSRFEEVARATADYYIESSPRDGIPYWDTGAPGLSRLPGYEERDADPFNDHEPVDSSAAAIAAQGLLRLGRFIGSRDPILRNRYFHAGLTVAQTLFGDRYLSTEPNHQGLLLHAVYHRPNGWDHIPPGRKIPCGESCLWGDYHALELGLLIQRLAKKQPYYAFFGW